MNIRPSRNKAGFTLLEILIVVAVISILAGVVIVAINPTRQLALARDSQRKNDVAEIGKAVLQYYIDHKEYPITFSKGPFIYEICNTRSRESSKCGIFIDISRLIPIYIAEAPIDPIVLKDRIGVGYSIALNQNSGIYIEAPDTEIGLGPEHKVISYGRPPEGYSIPSIGSVVPEIRTVKDGVQESVVTLVSNSWEWLRITLFISAIVIFIGLYIRRRYVYKMRGPHSSLLN